MASLATLLGRFYINWTQTGWRDPSSRFGSELRRHTRQVFEKNTRATTNSDVGQTVMTLTAELQETVPVTFWEQNLITNHYLHYNTLEFHSEDLTWLCWFKSNRWTPIKRAQFSQSTNAKSQIGVLSFKKGKKNWNLIFIFFFTLKIGCFGVKLFSTPTRQLWWCELSICGAIVHSLIYQRPLLMINGCHYDSGNIYEKNSFDSIRSWANSLRSAEELLICRFVEGRFINTVVVPLEMLGVVSFRPEWCRWMVKFWPLMAELPHWDEMRWTQRVWPQALTL